MADTQYITKNRLSQEVNKARIWVAVIGAPIAGFLMYNLPKFWWIVGLIYLFSILGAASTKRSGAKGWLNIFLVISRSGHRRTRKRLFNNWSVLSDVLASCYFAYVNPVL
ncbi:hypothetical protein [Idiomarina piscisalsi]|uniref:hypothetical protein n=1 Tax=Idiomarina piscisalsi TaxID=1096243 RepID=UPI0026ED6B62|nr:hypothetical protein [Idiomarina piscisalsi]